MIEGMSTEIKIEITREGPCFPAICVVNNNIEKAHHDNSYCSMRLCLKSSEPLIKIGKQDIECAAPFALLRFQYC